MSSATTAVSYPAPASSAAPRPYHVQASPPAGYPTRDEPQNIVPVETKSNGNGFWKGCCAALYCCYGYLFLSS
ncbi:hypothetical protein EV2_039189 [Malus domestica]